jgi:flavin reductase (DIM6/NTAB) family NADH-FMN oxidoreductase RutF
MTMGWHMVMEFEPSRIGCFITSANHSYDMIRRSRECVVNIPTLDLAKQVVCIGNTSGAHIDKFKKFNLTAVPAQHSTAEEARQIILADLEVDPGSYDDDLEPIGEGTGALGLQTVDDLACPD